MGEDGGLQGDEEQWNTFQKGDRYRVSSLDSPFTVCKAIRLQGNGEAEVKS